MSPDPKLERWIQTSLNTYFDNAKGGYKLFIEGQDIDLATQQKWVELRINGPRFKEASKDDHRIELEINLSCVIKLGANIYELHDMVGHFRALCGQPIPINKYRDTDPAQFVGCLKLRDDEANPIDVVPWGQVTLGTDAPVRVMNTTIDAYLQMEL